MNIQKPPDAIEWTRWINADGSVRRGYTWNVITGCKHGCRWKMPNGKIARCYAEAVAEGVARDFYPQGFNHHYFHKERLAEPGRVKDGAGIFLDSMSDLMGAWVKSEEIEQVLAVTRACPQHIFIILTKNAPRLLEFSYPENVVVMVSVPPDVMYGMDKDKERALNLAQQKAMIRRQMKVLAELKQTGKATTVGLSDEPMSWDVTEFLIPELDWIIEGAASNGPSEIFMPHPSWVVNVEDYADKHNIAVFHKGNVRPLMAAVKRPVREMFPGSVRTTA